MDVIWFVSGLVIGAVVGALLGYSTACLAILRKTSERDFNSECNDMERDHESN